MAEINNNMYNQYGFQIDRIDKKDNTPKQNAEIAKEEKEERNYVPDTGVLGRSQIHRLNGADITKSINDAVDMAENQPVRMNCSEMIFDHMYDKYIDAGLSEADAYTRALMDEEEFLDISGLLQK